MRILGLIPARGGSKGIPGKNIKPLGGKPLIAHAIAQGNQCPEIARCIVSTDDEEIARVARAWEGEVPFMRPAELATDQAPTLGVIRHALTTLAAAGDRYDAVCLLQTTNPGRTIEDISGAVRRFRESGADSLITVVPVPHEYNPHWVYEPDASGRYLRIATGEHTIIPRRQELPPAYIRNGAVYLTKTSVLLEQNSLYGDRTAYFVMPTDNYVNLDTPEDWNQAETLYAQKKLFTE